jgi:hypothetical protein
MLAQQWADLWTGAHGSSREKTHYSNTPQIRNLGKYLSKVKYKRFNTIKDL